MSIVRDVKPSVQKRSEECVVVSIGSRHSEGQVAHAFS